MPCIVALVVFSFLGVFSATHRKLAREAFDCVFRRVTLRPCDTGFDTKVKAKVLGKLINKSPKVAKFVGKNFEAMSWIFMILVTVSTIWTARGLYNYWAWGSCQGLNAGGFCAFDPNGENNKVSGVSEECIDQDIALQVLSLEEVDMALFPTLESESMSSLVLMGCYSCDFTRKVYPIISELRESEEFDYTFVHFATKQETEYLYDYDVCLIDQGKNMYIDWVDRLFISDKSDISKVEFVNNAAEEIGFDMAELNTCLNAESTDVAVKRWKKEVQKTGIYGTPTIFVDDTVLVGPKPARVYKRLVK